MQFTPSVGFSILSALISVGVTVVVWRHRTARGAVPIVAFTAATAVWTGGNALQAASTELAAKLFWVNVQYVGTTAVPLAWFAFACEYTGRPEWLTRRTLVALAAPGVLTLALAWTNDYHHLVRATSEVVTVDGVVVLRRTFGPAFVASIVYANLVNGLGTVLLLRGLVESRRIHRKQTLAVLAGTTVPWAAAGLFYNGFLSVEPEVFFAVTGVAFAYAIAEYELLDVVPVGRRTVVEELADPVLVLDGNDRIVDANPAANLAFGWASTDDAVGRQLSDACEACPALVEKYESGELPSEVVIEGTDGVQRYFDARPSSLSDRDESLSGTALVLSDVTARKRYEEHLERQNEHLERATKTIAHDLRNPLNVAQGRLEFVRDGDGGVNAHLDKVASAHHRMNDIVEQVLDMAHDETKVEYDYLSLERVARNAWENVETHDATFDFEGSDLSVVADRRQMMSVFENLFRNAIEHAGSHAAIRVGELREERATGTSLTPRSGFYVADDGSGVPVAERDRVFEQGYTTRVGGTGVGLAFVSNMADRHGWEISVTESDTGGAQFEVRGVEIVTAETR